MVGGVRMWNGKRIFDPDIGDIAAAYYGWQTSQYDEKECRRQIEKRREEDDDWELQRQARASEAVENAETNNSAPPSKPTLKEVVENSAINISGIPEEIIAAGSSTSSASTSIKDGTAGDTEENTEYTKDLNSASPILPHGVTFSAKSLAAQSPAAQSPVAQPHPEATQLEDLPMTDVAAISQCEDPADTTNPAAVVANETKPVERPSSVPVIDAHTFPTKATKESPTKPIPMSVPVAPIRGPFASVLSLMGFSSLQQESPVASTAS
ncbi:hypothetical protein BGX38DRAFT_1190550 [Terfezia claveryi]|nr:hypothetical protein BGX38DRAFT_1190550 [Terfezia claveryi]